MGGRLLSGGGLLVLLLAAGCATLVAAPRQPIAPDARRLIERLETRWREVASLRTLADIVIEQGGQRQQVRAVLLAQAPTSVRLEALSPMGQPLLLATVHDGRLTAYNATTQEAWTGAATPEVTARFFHLPFEPDDLVGVLAGRPVPPLDVRVASLVAADALGPSIEMSGATNRRRIWLDPETGVVQQFELVGGRAEVRVRYLRDGEEIRGFDVTTSPDVVRASVRYHDPQHNVPLAADAFRLTIPNGAKTQEIR